jgi:hypothetical protein
VCNVPRMTRDLPAEDQPPAQWRRSGSTIDTEAAAALPAPALDDPVSVGLLFCNALEDPGSNLEVLELLSTPESRNAWGDFTAAGNMLQAIEDRGYGSMVNEAVGATDVCYFKILGGVSESFQVVDAQPVSAAAVLTLVWRPERGQWLVHGLGDYLRPEEVPRTA